MKKKIKIVFIIFVLMTLCSCEYVSYNNGISKSEVEQLEKLAIKKEEYLVKIEGLSSPDLYRTDELKYYNTCIREASSEINECVNIEDVITIYDKYVLIIDDIKTDEEYDVEEALQALEEYRREKIEEITSYFDLSLYRLNEKGLISSKLLESINSINSCTDYSRINDIVREYQICSYQYKTDSELYIDELNELILTCISNINSKYNNDDYRDNEKIIIKSLKQQYTSLINAASTKANVIDLFDSFVSIGDDVKTDLVLYAEEKCELVDVYYNEALARFDIESMTEEDANQYLIYCNDFKNEMLSSSTKEQVTMVYLEEKKNSYIIGAKLGDLESLEILQQIYIEQLNNHVVLDDYRIEEKNLIKEEIIDKTSCIDNATNYDDIILYYEDSLEQIDAFFTNDELWIQEDKAFITNMENKYCDNLLPMPDSITKADDYYELANIIDYYAFYQIDSTSFERNKFRVKINWIHKDATYEKNEVYWYCELIRVSIGMDCIFEPNDYLVITLIPYQAPMKKGSTSNIVSGINSSVKYGLNNHVLRSNDFVSFPYKSFENKAKVWNTQQLWYALEHKIAPICLNGSIAEQCLEIAENILREIISDDMTNDEKIFYIYKWIAENISYDWYCPVNSNELDSSYPDIEASKYRQMFLEGAIIDKVAVCYGYVDITILLLSMENINCKRHHMRTSTDNVISQSYHCFAIVQMDDEKYYINEALFAIHFPPYKKYGFLNCVVCDTNFMVYMFDGIKISKDGYTDFYKQLYFDSLSLYIENELQLVAFLQYLANKEVSSDITVSIYYDSYSSLEFDLTKYIDYDYYIKEPAHGQKYINEIVL